MIIIKNNNFDTIEKFEEYMKTNYPHRYDVQYYKFKEELGVYEQSIDLIPKDNSNTEETSMNIIMKLKENTDFVMSFNIK